MKVSSLKGGLVSSNRGTFDEEQLAMKLVKNQLATWYGWVLVQYRYSSEAYFACFDGF